MFRVRSKAKPLEILLRREERRKSDERIGFRCYRDCAAVRWAVAFESLKQLSSGAVTLCEEAPIASPVLQRVFAASEIAVL